MTRAILSSTVQVALLLLSSPQVFGADTQVKALPSLVVESRFSVPDSTDSLVDLRWASKDSIFLVNRLGGVVEAKLTNGLPTVSTLVPPAKNIGLTKIRRAAISDKWIVVVNRGQIAWKRRENTSINGGWQVAPKSGAFHDVDIRDDELLILGWPPGDGMEGLEDGGIVWRADLSKGLEQWDEVFRSKLVAQDPDRMSAEEALGSIRFLSHGGFLIAPNFTPGVDQFSASGSVKRHWEPEDLGTGGHPWSDPKVGVKEFARFLSSGSTIDLVLPLAQGPAIVVREADARGAHYRLAILGPEIEWYEIPLTVSPYSQLRGDVDSKGRIVLAGVVRVKSAQLDVSTKEIAVLSIP